MAVLALTAIGSALGGSLLPAGISVFGATLSGAALGGAIGGLAGSAIDQALLAPTIKSSGPRLQDLSVTTSVEGSPVLRVYGRMRVGGQIVWAARLREDKETSRSGGKGGGGVKQTTYSYYGSFAVGLCEGPIDGIGRIWADGEILDTEGLEIRLYKGGEVQLPDPKIVAVEGAEFAPAYRGLAYLMFEELPLERYGNRVPQITVEVIRRPYAERPALEDLLRGVTLIPGASEFAYATDVVERAAGYGAWVAENANGPDGRADLVASLDELEAVAPRVGSVSLVVAWHGTDLRVGHCRVVPKVEGPKQTRPWAWRCGSLTRETAETVSLFGGSPAVGGAPSDRSVYQAIRELKSRGLKVMMNPFVMMDVAPGNGLPDPFGGAEQAAYPWRGRITCAPAPGRPGSPDGTAAIAGEVAAFFGTVGPAQFGWSSSQQTVAYSGPAEEFSYRRFVLHCARISASAGGVDAFLLGSEMIGLTTLRDAPGSYPAVAALKELAADVREILGPETRIGYAADWTEFPPHRPADGSNDLVFHLDPLWAGDEIDFVGVDLYAPLADWRDGAEHLDARAGFGGPRDAAYLDANIEGGEGFDWFYASEPDRLAQIRTPIADTAHGEHWVFRNKDFRSWWENPHHDRPGGVRSAVATGWVPGSKPIVLCEIGCSAVDKGANQPNVFVDPKSSESFLPRFSDGRADV